MEAWSVFSNTHISQLKGNQTQSPVPKPLGMGRSGARGESPAATLITHTSLTQDPPWFHHDPYSCPCHLYENVKLVK